MTDSSRRGSQVAQSVERQILEVATWDSFATTRFKVNNILIMVEGVHITYMS